MTYLSSRVRVLTFMQDPLLVAPAEYVSGRYGTLWIVLKRRPGCRKETRSG
jgi:hypothetical protein